MEACREARTPGAPLASYGAPGRVPNVGTEATNTDSANEVDDVGAGSGLEATIEPTPVQRRRLARFDRHVGHLALTNFSRALRHAGGWCVGCDARIDAPSSMRDNGGR